MTLFTLYKYATWGLLFLNIAIITFFLLTKPKPGHHPSSNNFQQEVIEILNLNDEQISTFKKLATEHHQKLTTINERQQKLLPPYFESLSELSKGIDEEAILQQFQQLEREKIEVTRQHFQEIKSMLNESQLIDFEELIGRFVDRILLNKTKSPPPPKNFK